MYHWFLCPCGHRWDGASQRAKDLAWRLHKKKCEIAVDDLINSELRPIKLERESPSQATKEYAETERVRGQRARREEGILFPAPDGYHPPPETLVCVLGRV
jgi:hypothetical protein